MKKALSLFLSLIMVMGVFISVPVTVNAASVDDLTFELNETGESYDVIKCEPNAMGEVIIPDTYNSKPVVRIGDYAFENCTKITKIVIGNKITTIGEYAFKNCYSLKSVILPENVSYNKSSTTIINSCQDISDWNTHKLSDCEIDTQNFISGTQSIRSKSGAMVCLKNIYDMVNNYLTLKIRINNIANGAHLYMQVYNTAEPSNSVVYELMRGNVTTPIGEWREITVPFSAYAWGKFNEVDFTSIDFIRIYASGGEVDWNLQYVGIKPVISDKGIISFTFDDGYKSQYQGLKILGEKGIKGTLFYIPEANTNGSEYYLKIPDLQSLVNRYHTDVEVHGASSFNDKTDDELIAYWESAQRLLKENGLGEGRHMAYPNGMHSDRVVNLSKKYFDSCRTIQYYLPSETYLPADDYRIRAISSIGAKGNNVDYVKDKIDRAMQSNSWLILVFHKIEDGNSTMYCSEKELEAIADYAIASGAEIKTVAEVMDSVSTVRNTVGTISIGRYAFYSCTKLESVSIPESVSEISENAFGYYFNENSGLFQKKENFVIKGSIDSAASRYAKENGFNFVDLNHTHTPSNWIVDKSATVDAEGSKHKECTGCGKILETAVIPQLKPATPKLTAIANTASGVKVTWGKVNGADSYIVYRRAYNATTKKWGSWTRIADDVTATSYVDKTAKSGTYYLYTVKAVNEAGNSGYNTSGIKTYFLTVPKSVTTANTTHTITVKWGKVAGATGYIVYRKTGDGKWVNLGKIKGTSFADKTANVGVTYRYTVKAYYGSYVSAYNTNGYAVRRLTIPTLKSAVSSKTGITFTWNKVTGATGYIVYRKTGSGSWQRLGTVKTNNYLDKTAKKGVTYKYTVKAYYGTSTSHYNSKGLAVKDKY